VETKVTNEELMKSLKDIAEAAQKAAARNEELPAKIAEAVKGVLAAAPAAEPKRDFGFDGSDVKGRAEADILGNMKPELRKKLDGIFIASKLLGRDVTSMKSWADWKREAGDFKKALDTAASGGGSEWVPTGYSNDLWEMVRLESRVWGLFREIAMPTNPYVLPYQPGTVTSYKQAEQTGDTGQTKIPVGDSGNLTGKTTLTAAGHAARVLFSLELEEDSIIPILPFLSRDVAKAIAEGREDAILNGDSAGTHEDSDIGAGSLDSRRRLWLGLRAGANDNAGLKVDLATFNADTLRGLRSVMGKFGVDPSKLALIVGVKGYIKLLGLKDSSNNPMVTTLDKLGPAATILTGQLGQVDGMPVIVSSQIREDLNATGVYDGVTTTKTALHIVYRDGFAAAVRGTPDVRALRELYAESGQVAFINKERVAFAPVYPLASNAITAMGYNIA